MCSLKSSRRSLPICDSTTLLQADFHPWFGKRRCSKRLILLLFQVFGLNPHRTTFHSGIPNIRGRTELINTGYDFERGSHRSIRKTIRLCRANAGKRRKGVRFILFSRKINLTPYYSPRERREVYAARGSINRGSGKCLPF